MGKIQWVCTLAICPDEIKDLDKKTIMATLVNGQQIPIPIHMVDYEHLDGFNPAKMLEAYNKQNNLTIEE